ncbi:MAG TPA: hypothetical protein VFD15_03750 [Clostridia bacterium]|nr:hypothetical protein [Clostridia bacterium]
MDNDKDNTILAVITKDRDMVAGGAPIFFATDDEEAERISLYLSKILLGMVHDLENGIFIIVRH